MPGPAITPRRYVRVLTGPELVDSLARATEVPTEFSFAGTTVERVKELTTPSDLGGRRGRGEGAEVDALMQSFFQSNRMTPGAGGEPGLHPAGAPHDAVGGREPARFQRGPEDAWPTSSPRRRARATWSTSCSWERSGRLPTAAEAALGAERIAADRQQGTQDLQWALLNSPEFLLNH